MRRTLLSGALAGTTTTLVFAIAHQLAISDIWFSIVPMLLIGALCGMVLAWSYRVVFEVPAAGSWIGYNGAYLAALLLMGGLSLALFEPVTTAEAILVSGGPPPPELFDRALPFTVLFTLAAAGVISGAWGRSLPKAGAVLVTSVVLVFLFGLNLSIIGLVELSGDGYRALGEFLLLTVLIVAGNAAAFLLLERRRWRAEGWGS